MRKESRERFILNNREIAVFDYDANASNTEISNPSHKAVSAKTSIADKIRGDIFSPAKQKYLFFQSEAGN